MAVSWMPLTPDARAALSAAGLETCDDDGLATFPSERESWDRRSQPRAARRSSGVTMRIAPLSGGVALGLIGALLLGVGAAVLIALLARPRADGPRGAAVSYDARR
jgi:hypothetical protein